MAVRSARDRRRHWLPLAEPKQAPPRPAFRAEQGSRRQGQMLVPSQEEVSLEAQLELPRPRARGASEGLLKTAPHPAIVQVQHASV
jgi:hypothetical protein